MVTAVTFSVATPAPAPSTPLVRAMVWNSSPRLRPGPAPDALPHSSLRRYLLHPPRCPQDRAHRSPLLCAPADAPPSYPRQYRPLHPTAQPFHLSSAPLNAAAQVASRLPSLEMTMITVRGGRGGGGLRGGFVCRVACAQGGCGSSCSPLSSAPNILSPIVVS